MTIADAICETASPGDVVRRVERVERVERVGRVKKTPSVGYADSSPTCVGALLREIRSSPSLAVKN